MQHRTGRWGLGFLAAMGLLVAGVAEAGQPGGDDRLEGVWQRRTPPSVAPVGTELAQILASSAAESRLEGASRELLAGSFALMEMLEIGVLDLEVRFYQGGGSPLTLPIRKKLKAGAPGARMEMVLAWEGPILVMRRKVNRGASSVERIYVGSDKKLHVELDWTGPPAREPLRVVTVFDRLSGGLD